MLGIAHGCDQDAGVLGLQSCAMPAMPPSPNFWLAQLPPMRYAVCSARVMGDTTMSSASPKMRRPHSSLAYKQQIAKKAMTYFLQGPPCHEDLPKLAQAMPGLLTLALPRFRQPGLSVACQCAT